MSNRQCVLLALQKHGESTYDELEQTTGIPRDKLRIAINDAKKVLHVVANKDVVTGQPAYAITEAGIKWLGINVAEQPEEKPAAKAESAEQPAPKAEQATPIPQLARIIELEAKLADWQRVSLAVGSESPDELQAFLGFQDQELVEANRKLNEAQPRILALELAVEESRKQIEALERKPAKENPERRWHAISGYIVVRPKKPMRRFTALASAQLTALNAVRAGSSAEVFALVPEGKAIRGAEWKAYANEFPEWAKSAQVR